MSSKLFIGNGFFAGNLTRRSIWGSLKLSSLIWQKRTVPNTLKSSFLPKLGPVSKPLFNRISIKNYASWRNIRFQPGRSSPPSGRSSQSGYKQLIAPFAIFAVSTIGLLFALPILFQIPPLTIFNKNPELLIYAIILANVAVFFMWRIPSFYVTLTEHFLLHKPLRSMASMIGSAFSHQDTWHLGLNMMMLYSFGIQFVNQIGPANFTLLYISSALFASFVSLAWPVVLGIRFMAPSLGASGALSGLFAMFAYLIPKAGVAIMFIPFPGGAWSLLMAFSALNFAGMVLRWSGLDYAAHLGGTVMGIFYGWLLAENTKRKRRGN